MIIPLLEAYIVGGIQLLAGASFLIPSKMPRKLKRFLAICYAAMGVIYIWIALGNLDEITKASIIRLILGATGGAIVIMNVGAFVTNYFESKAKKLNADTFHMTFDKRKDD